MHVLKWGNLFQMKQVLIQLFHDETSSLICSGFYTIGSSIMKELKKI